MKKTVCKILFTGLLCFLFVLSGCSRSSYLQAKGAQEEQGKTKLSLGSMSHKKARSEVKEAPKGQTIFVQVAGQVHHPGVYELQKDSRVFEAIRAAGGLTKKAYDRELNQASVLEDGQKIYVFSVKELKKEQSENQTTSSTTKDGSQTDPVHLNQADKNLLMTLPGIGSSRADAILAYREEHGAFKDTKDLTKVSGIGPSIFEKIKDKIII
jgi:competence protein ComEA